MKIRFQRDEHRRVTIGSVEGRPEATREFWERDLASYAPYPNDPLEAWVQELIDYLGEEVEHIILA